MALSHAMSLTHRAAATLPRLLMAAHTLSLLALASVVLLAASLTRDTRGRFEHVVVRLVVVLLHLVLDPRPARLGHPARSGLPAPR